MKIKIKQYDPASRNFVHTTTLYGNPKQQQQQQQPAAATQGVINLDMLQSPLNLIGALEPENDSGSDNGRDAQLNQKTSASVSVETWRRYMTRYATVPYRLYNRGITTRTGKVLGRGKSSRRNLVLLITHSTVTVVLCVLHSFPHP